MNKQFDLFVKMKIKELSENISRMTYAYINPDTKQPTVVPAKHYKDILDQPVEVMVNDQVKRQFLNIMFSYIINHSQVCSILTIMILTRTMYMTLTLSDTV